MTPPFHLCYANDLQYCLKTDLFLFKNPCNQIRLWTLSLLSLFFLSTFKGTQILKFPLIPEPPPLTASNAAAPLLPLLQSNSCLQDTEESNRKSLSQNPRIIWKHGAKGGRKNPFICDHFFHLWKKIFFSLVNVIQNDALWVITKSVHGGWEALSKSEEKKSVEFWIMRLD